MIGGATTNRHEEHRARLAHLTPLSTPDSLPPLSCNGWTHEQQHPRNNAGSAQQPSRRGSRGGPPPPLPDRPRSAAASGPGCPRSPAPRSSATPARRDDRGVLLTLLFKCSPPPSAANASAKSGWLLSTGWSSPTPLNRWYGVSTRHERGVMAGTERVTGLTLVGNGLCGESLRRGWVWFCLRVCTYFVRGGLFRDEGWFAVLGWWPCLFVGAT